MSDFFRRSQPNHLDRARRIVHALFAVAVFVGSWLLLRTAVLQQAARMSFGIRERNATIWQAVSERYGLKPYPDLAIGTGLQVRNYSQVLHSVRTRRFANAVAADGTAGIGDRHHDWLALDGELTPRYRIRSFYQPTSLADRDSEEGWEAVFSIWFTTAAGPARERHAVVKLGRNRHRLIAVVDSGNLEAPQSNPIWTVASNTTQSLEWFDMTIGVSGVVSRVASVFQLRWIAPGRMVAHGNPPGRVWLADDTHEATFAPDEAVENVVLRVMGE